MTTTAEPNTTAKEAGQELPLRWLTPEVLRRPVRLAIANASGKAEFTYGRSKDEFCLEVYKLVVGYFRTRLGQKYQLLFVRLSPLVDEEIAAAVLNARLEEAGGILRRGVNHTLARGV